jgi:hypothetical protein
MKTITCDFKIIKELHYRYVDSKDIYLMLIKSDNLFIVELNSRTKLIARKTLHNQKNAEILFKLIDFQLGISLFFEDCVSLVEFAFRYNRLNSTFFALYVCKIKFKYEEIRKVKRRLLFTTEYLFEEDDSVYISNPKEIKVILSQHQKSIGSFIKTDKDLYVFEFSTDFI